MTGGSAMKVNEHNGWIPRDWWLEDREKQPSSSYTTKILLRVIGVSPL